MIKKQPIKRLFFTLVIVSLFIYCLNGTTETGIPEIRSFRILGYDASGGYVDKYTFQNSGDWPYLEFTVYDDDLDINEITIILDNTTSPDGKRNLVFPLYQNTNPQTYIYPITVIQGGMMGQDNLWYLQFFVTDKNGKRSKTHSSTFTVKPFE